MSVVLSRVSTLHMLTLELLAWCLWSVSILLNVGFAWDTIDGSFMPALECLGCRNAIHSPSNHDWPDYTQTREGLAGTAYRPSLPFHLGPIPATVLLACNPWAFSLRRNMLEMANPPCSSWQLVVPARSINARFQSGNNDE